MYLSNLFCKLAHSYGKSHLAYSISFGSKSITHKTDNMKHPKLILTLIFVMGLGVIASNAQKGVVSAGGEAIGSGGSMSFSTGQTDFMYFSSESGSIHFGLQQVFFFDDEEIPVLRELTTGDLFQGEDQCFDATQTIVLAGRGDTFIVEAETGVDLIAGHSILMLQGTMVEYGGYLSAKISSDGVFCDLDEPIVASLQADQAENTTYAEPFFIHDRDKPGNVFFRVYPNPTAGKLTLEMLTTGLPYEAITIEIIGMRGEVVKRIDHIRQLQYQLSLKDYNPGLYVVRVQRGEQVGMERIIKQ